MYVPSPSLLPWTIVMVSSSLQPTLNYLPLLPEQSLVWPTLIYDYIPFCLLLKFIHLLFLHPSSMWQYLVTHLLPLFGWEMLEAQVASLSCHLVSLPDTAPTVKWSDSRSVLSNSLRSHGLKPARLLCPWNSPGKNTGVGCHSLLQGIFPTQVGLPPCRQILYHLSHRGSRPLIKDAKS